MTSVELGVKDFGRIWEFIYNLFIYYYTRIINSVLLLNNHGTHLEQIIFQFC